MDTPKILATIQQATWLFKKSRRYIRKKDMKFFFRCKFLTKDDIDFLEQIILIHLKNIYLDSKIAQNFDVILNNFMLNTFFTQHFFTSMEMFKILCYRFLSFTKKIFLKDVKFHLRHILNEDIMKMKPQKNMRNAVSFIQPFPNMQNEIDLFIHECQNILMREKFDILMIHPLNLALNPKLQRRENLIREISENLKIIVNNSNAKMVVLENTHEFFDEILESVKLCVQDIAYPISIAITLPTYHLDSMDMFEKIIEAGTDLCKKKKAKLIIRLKDLDFYYEYESFVSNFNHKPNTIFTNPTSAMGNFIDLLQKYQENTSIVDCIVASQNFLLIAFIKTFHSNIALEVQKELNYPLFQVIKKDNISLIHIQYYTKDFTQVLPFFLKSNFIFLQQGLFKTIHLHQNTQELQKEYSSFERSWHTIKAHKQDTLQDSALYLQEQSYNFETFDYELRKPLLYARRNDKIQEIKQQHKQNIFQDSLTTEESPTKEMNQQSSHSFAKELDSIIIDPLNYNKIEDILYLNTQDMERIRAQGINNTPNVFSLNTEKEKELLQLAYKKQEDILLNRINLITSIIARLKEISHDIHITLHTIYPNTPPYILEEQFYICLDTFKYYAYEYRQLLHQTDSVLMMPSGAIFIDTKKLSFCEIVSILASNIMIGNVSILNDTITARFLYYIFYPIFEACPFMTIIDSDSKFLESFRTTSHGYIIIPKDDISKYLHDDNLLVWDRGKSAVFISSFYNFYEAYLQVQEMRFFGADSIIIYTDEYIYSKAKQVFIPIQVVQSSLGDVIANLDNEVSNFSLFTYNKTEMNYAINHLNISISINTTYKYKLVSGSQHTFLPGLLPPFGSNLLLAKLLQTSPNSVIRNNSLYSDIIGCFSMILSVDETEFLYNLNHNYSQFLKKLERVASFDNIYEVKKPYNMCLRVYHNDDFFHVCVVMLVAFLLEIPTKISFEMEYFKTRENIFSKLKSELSEKYINIFTLVLEHETDFIAGITPKTLVRILQDESDFSHHVTYMKLKDLNIIAEYSLPILNKNLELERYLATQYIHIQPNFFLRTYINE
ncbi:hypothetical protein CQA53_03885 [Helicobacter didelphidarum]|uniref:Uncharacterized protein n=1 Tax=Helicobacter didelphidarum TaxID=2040648 RepID=A0A3D8INC7_9HELI|nr:hypothetical protein CQA53_03885 [Helicobacter didelphidarum]